MGQAQLRQSFNFVCRCEVCLVEGAERKLRDACRKRYKELDNAILENKWQELDAALEVVLEMASIIQDEFDGDPHLVQRAFHDGFQFALLAGDLQTAADWMARAHEA